MKNDNSLGKKIAGILLFAIGLTFLIFLLKDASKDIPIWLFGRNVTGVVEEKWYELIEENNAGELSFEYFMGYSFTTPQGERMTGSSRLSAQEWVMYTEGGEVDVIYTSFNPANNRVDDSRFRPLLICSYIPFALVIWFCLIWGWNMLSEEFRKVRPVPWDGAPSKTQDA